jgi:protein O-GlcNAc transferase
MFDLLRLKLERTFTRRRRALGIAAVEGEQLTAWQHQADRLMELKQYAEACPLYEQILAAVPDDLYVAYQLAGALEGVGNLERAAAICERGLAMSPDQPGLLSRRGAIARRRTQYVLALETYQRLKSLHPDFQFIDAMIGDALALLGRGAEAIEAFDRALLLAPDNTQIQSDRLFILNYFNLMNREQLFEEHRKWGTAHEASLRGTWRPHRQSRDPQRRLRVGYVSPDLRHHAVAFFIEGVLRHHDHAQFEIHAFDVSPFALDTVSRRLKSFCDHWHRLGDRGDDELAETIRRQEIDVLVDLSGHTAHNRLLVFARRPAPIQAGWFGYMNTTGLSAIDYRLTDGWLDPPGESDAFYTETLFRLPSAACFQPDPESPNVGPLPALRNGFVTVASLNQWTKVTEITKDIWSQIVLRVPSARLVVVALGGDDCDVRAAILREFVARGVPGERIEVRGFRPLKQFLAFLNDVDFALDPFPYGGGTTTLQAAWMGVPTVTLQSDSELGRSTPGILGALELPELVTTDADRYICTAVALAGDSTRLAGYRAQLRERFRRSSLMDAVPLTRSVEAAYRAMWNAYCDRAHAG